MPNLNLEIFNAEKTNVPRCISWGKVIGDVKSEYEAIMQEELDRIIVPRLIHSDTDMFR